MLGDDDDGDSESDTEAGKAGAQVAAFTPASDVYALGLVFYAITTGKEPWEKVVKQHPVAPAVKVAKKVLKGGRPPLKPADGAQPFLDAQLRACWEQDPAARPTASEVLRRFEQRQRDGRGDGRRRVRSTVASERCCARREGWQAFSAPA